MTTTSAPRAESTTSTTATVNSTTTLSTTTTTGIDLATRFVPEVLIEGYTASLVVTFPDGSSADLSWPVDLDLLSGGVTPYAWAQVPHRQARDFFIRRGHAEEVVGVFGSPRLMEEYEDPSGGEVGLWRPEGWSDVDFLAFEFDSWVVLVYDYRTGETGGDPMADDDRQVWVSSLHGRETEDGFLVLSADEPLRIAGAGAYPSPMSLTLWSEEGEMDLVPEVCVPGFISPTDVIDDGDEFSHWCDASGLLSLRIVGPHTFAQRVHDHLRVSNVQVVAGT